jgi:hypothetical protein
MELFAARKVREMEKKRAAEYQKAPSAPMSAEKKEELDRLFGFPKPPDLVYALGKDGAAGVWWHFEDDSEILDWEIHRYRKELHGDNWQHKGIVEVKFLKRFKQVVVSGLTNGREVIVALLH